MLRPSARVHTASIYGLSRVERLCPWCSASGLAQERFDATFSDGDSLSGVPSEVREGVTRRTPGFASWQQERWLAHHGDACAFLGPAGRKEIKALGSEELVASLRHDADFLSDEEFAGYYAGMDRDGQPTAYVFRCLHCDTLLGYSDFT